MADSYQFDTIEAYRFTKSIIDGYLQDLFGYFDYYTELSCDKYRFWVPRKLTEPSSIADEAHKVERQSLLKLRLPDPRKAK